MAKIRFVAMRACKDELLKARIAAFRNVNRSEAERPLVVRRHLFAVGRPDLPFVFAACAPVEPDAPQVCGAAKTAPAPPPGATIWMIDQKLLQGVPRP